MSTFYLLVGVPGSGKSRLATQLALETGAVIVCPDDIRTRRRVRSERAFEIAREEISKNIRAGCNVIFDATNTIRKWRRENILAGKPYASQVVCCVIDTPLELCLNRQRWRAAQGEKVNLPESTIVRMYDQLTDNPPSLVEGFDEIRIYAGIVIKMMSGPYLGQTRRVFLDMADPIDLISSCVFHGWHWEIDYSLATPEEKFFWLRADLVYRAVLAKQESRPICFEGREYPDFKEWRDAVSSSGQMVIIDRDDETGYWVKGIGPKPTVY